MAKDGGMDLTGITTTRPEATQASRRALAPPVLAELTAPAATSVTTLSSPVDATPSAVPQHFAWFDLNGDGKIENFSTIVGGDGYLNNSVPSVIVRPAPPAPAAPASPAAPAAPTDTAKTQHLTAKAVAAYRTYG